MAGRLVHISMSKDQGSLSLQRVSGFFKRSRAPPIIWTHDQTILTWSSGPDDRTSTVKLATGCTKLVTDIKNARVGVEKIVGQKNLVKIWQNLKTIRITWGCPTISPHKIIWLFPNNFLVSLTTKCITDDLLLTLVNKIWGQPFELELEYTTN